MPKSIFGTVLQWWLTFGKRSKPEDEQKADPTYAIAQPPQSSAISIVPLQAGGTYYGPMERYTEQPIETAPLFDLIGTPEIREVRRFPPLPDWRTQLIEAKKKDVIEAKMRKENPPRIDRFTIARRQNDRE